MWFSSIFLHDFILVTHPTFSWSTRSIGRLSSSWVQLSNESIRASLRVSRSPDSPVPLDESHAIFFSILMIFQVPHEQPERSQSIVKYIEVRLRLALKWMNYDELMNWPIPSSSQPFKQHFETPSPPSKMLRAACCVPGEAFAANWGPDFSRFSDPGSGTQGPCKKWRKLLRTSLSETCSSY